MKELLEKLINQESLSENEMENLMIKIMEGKVDPINISALLIALRIKNESVSEITGAARAMRAKAKIVDFGETDTLDNCGTGGDGLKTFNISTACSFIAAAAGIKVVKHGNRSISSNCGSADVLEALGAKIDLTPKEVKQCVDDINLGFFFAPAFHPAMKYAAPIRKTLGVRTIFNLIGPLTNPALCKYHMLGIYDGNLTSIVAQVLKNLGSKRAMVVHGNDGLDEISLTTTTKVTELKDNKILEYEINPLDYGLNLCAPEDLKGGTSKENAQIIIDIFNGKKGPKRDIVILNSAASLYVCNKCSSLEEGIFIAKEIIDKGLALKKLDEFITLTNNLSNSSKEDAI